MTVLCSPLPSITHRKDSVVPVESHISHSTITPTYLAMKSPTENASIRNYLRKTNSGILCTHCYRQHLPTIDREPRWVISGLITFLSTKTDKSKWLASTHGLGNRPTTPRPSTRRKSLIFLLRKSRTTNLVRWNKALTSNWPKPSQLV